MSIPLIVEIDLNHLTAISAEIINLKGENPNMGINLKPIKPKYNSI